MSDYTKTTNFTAKDALASGDPNKVIKGSEHDTEFDNIATMSQTKANKVASPTSGNVAELTGTGDISDGGFAFPNLVGNATADVTEMNILDGATVTTAELNILDGATLDVNELNGLDGLTANKGVATDASGILKSLTATDTELDYVAGVTSAIQTQFDDYLKYTQYIAGLTLSNNLADANADIDIAAGMCISEDGTYTRMVLTAGVTRQLDAVFGTGNGGRASAISETANTWYHVFVIKKDSDGSIDVYFDTSASAANIPAGYTEYRCIGSFYNNASSNITAFKQYEDRFLLDVPVSSFANITTSGNQTVLTPLGRKVDAIIGARIDSVTSGTGCNAHALLRDPDITGAAASATICQLAVFDTDEGTEGAARSASEIIVTTNISSQVYLSLTNTAGTTKVNGATIGWIDRRGKI